MTNKLPHTLIRNKTYHYKRRVPTHLQSSAEFDGLMFVQFSLKTKDARVALDSLAAANRLFEQRVQLAENETSSLTEKITFPLSSIQHPYSAQPNIRAIQTAVDKFFDEYILTNSLDEDGLRSRTNARNLESLVAGRRAEDWENILNELGRPNEQNLRSFDAALDICQNNGWELEPDDRLFHILQDLLRKAERTAVQQILDAAESDEYTPSYVTKMRESRQEDFKYTLTDAVDGYIRRYPERSDMAKKLRLALDVWRDLVGVESFGAIDSRMVIDFTEQLERLPKSASLRFPNLSFSRAILKNSKRVSPYPVLSAKTVKVNYVGVLNTAARLALDRSRIGNNPFTGIKVQGSSKIAEHRRAFNADNLKTVFQHPIFTGCHSKARRYTAGPHIYRDSHYWSPIIGLFTGMRASEIGALKTSDLRSVHVSDELYWYLQVDGTKTHNAKREIPIHPDLVALGFIDFCKNKANSGDVRLFEEWTRPKGKKFSEARVIRNFNEKICAEFGEPGRRLSFHCFRQTLQTAMIRGELSLTVEDAILGHAQKGMKANYYKPDIQDYAEQFCRDVQFDFVDLTHLKRT